MFWYKRRTESLEERCQMLDKQTLDLAKQVADYRRFNGGMESMLRSIGASLVAFNVRSHLPPEVMTNYIMDRIQELKEKLAEAQKPIYGESILQEVLNGIDRKVLQENRDLRAKLEELQRPKNEAKPAKGNEAQATCMLQKAKEIIAYEEANRTPWLFASPDNTPPVQVSNIIRWLVQHIELLESGHVLASLKCDLVTYKRANDNQHRELQYLRAEVERLEKTRDTACNVIKGKSAKIAELREMNRELRKQYDDSAIRSHQDQIGRQALEIRDLHFEVDRLKSQLTAGK